MAWEVCVCVRQDSARVSDGAITMGNNALTQEGVGITIEPLNKNALTDLLGGKQVFLVPKMDS